jgi:hypothetical protein
MLGVGLASLRSAKTKNDYGTADDEERVLRAKRDNKRKAVEWSGRRMAKLYCL